ncbi:type IV toxin-antitoxin system AbiEi family antitoxin domain-containing protein [Ihubacter sp. rT4E-8]|uniref:type IV toxin-antitoxin system AbiEi family antitoxin domain-containing protein n=1 Tax=Ihubacter sp. rT4E-8 TaxID=3242369 RepID=UPI003CF7AEC3
MIQTTSMLLTQLQDYANPNTKLSRLVKNGNYYPIVNGLYETEKDTPGYLLAGSIYGPSYLSFDFALAYHGLIPEMVFTFTSATFEKKKKKRCFKRLLDVSPTETFLPMSILWESV